MGRKRNKGKARRAARAKAREEEVDEGNNNPTANSCEQSSLSEAQMLQQFIDGEEKCKHAFDPSITTDDSVKGFVNAFTKSFVEAMERGQTLTDYLIEARDATLDEFADVWRDSAKMEKALSFYYLLEINYHGSRLFATIARFFEQSIAALFKQTQALINWVKLDDMYYSDDHTLVKFFRHRIPCSCLDEKYDDVKHISKMGLCHNPQCSIPGRKVERSKTMYCSRCRDVTYCSRECQIADWTGHKPICDEYAAIIAEFEAKRQE